LDNIDINVWDRVAYETDGEHSGGWELHAYAITNEGHGYGTGPDLEHKLALRARDVMRMGLDWEGNDDFWLDGKTFLEDVDAPRRVRIWIEEALGLVQVRYGQAN
jgi:hypothetical protein